MLRLNIGCTERASAIKSHALTDGGEAQTVQVVGRRCLASEAERPDRGTREKGGGQIHASEPALLGAKQADSFWNAAPATNTRYRRETQWHVLPNRS